jgi:Ca2+-binding EF-hand superfamily protein
MFMFLVLPISTVLLCYGLRAEDPRETTIITTAQELINGVDTDGDGKIGKDEAKIFAAAPGHSTVAKMFEDFDHFDSNEDGVLTFEETKRMIREVMVSRMKAPMSEHIEKVDKKHAESTPTSQAARIMASADKNYNQVASKSELSAIAGSDIFPQTWFASVDSFDVNHDGNLDMTELTNLVESFSSPTPESAQQAAPLPNPQTASPVRPVQPVTPVGNAQPAAPVVQPPAQALPAQAHLDAERQEKISQVAVKLLRALDLDGDQMISKAEEQAAGTNPNYRKFMPILAKFDSWDTDKNGKLDLSEISHMLAESTA